MLLKFTLSCIFIVILVYILNYAGLAKEDLQALTTSNDLKIAFKLVYDLTLALLCSIGEIIVLFMYTIASLNRKDDAH